MVNVANTTYDASNSWIQSYCILLAYDIVVIGILVSAVKFILFKSKLTKGNKAKVFQQDLDLDLF
ncbi:hypothetical protein IMG5_149920 [Ichthyophthirius multifiliis]|uniref:Uncharacterized protein n=1 Tax=Ichthyophthirius multifiliis TaxID=5932 RepID=G0QYI5_ICHMU|nr:hypothetical protein IMG5_149920 [Ichthyophthirius multifiliis]EGR29724.1 hypothetical protein IMG5_149920 [Ichthyophthirius multifiliis]|eukprot:XP_004030960.1 hypothetical protein IMG5_149920 [Ichthyophthirius multifiliis]